MDYPNFRLDNKVAIVTGANREIGGGTYRVKVVNQWSASILGFAPIDPTLLIR